MILLIDFGSNKTEYIEEIIDEFCDVKRIPFIGLSSVDLTNITGVVLSGAPILITEVNTDLYIEKMEWIKTTTLPVFGICFGHQLIGLLHGAFGTRMKEARDWQTVEAFEESILFNRLPSEIEMMQDHCESISIPAHFKLIASSDACVNEVMQHESNPIFGVQFHPEVSGNHGRILIENFVNICMK
ncbi:MAG: gamma-glutamyl-gamma-aminobutyrate hydrolase family protein [Crocinitomicaceae bacterium]|nr:gamma-glutamyl-gamma-aminobutyrate hydrolase family protein [Crocinitomicaceae bacterium]